MLINNKITSFDFLRFILAVCVVIGHTFVVLFQVKQTTIIIHNLAVDGFFVLSGFLLALSYAKTNKDMKAADLFLNQTKKTNKTPLAGIFLCNHHYRYFIGYLF